MAADLRAPTPSAAAELVVKEKDTLKKTLEDYKKDLIFSLEYAIESNAEKLDMYKSALSVYTVAAKIAQAESRLDFSLRQINGAVTAGLGRNEMKLEQYRALLYGLNPRGVLERGYSIVYDENGNVVKTADAAVGNLQIEFKDGRAAATGRGR